MSSSAEAVYGAPVLEAKDPVPLQRGLLDLSVDLSVPEVYSGSDFTVYLHVKNPFEVPVWISSVELSLPTRLEWRSTKESTEDSLPTLDEKSAQKRINKLRREVRKLREQRDTISGDDEISRTRRTDIEDDIDRLDEDIRTATRILYRSRETDLVAQGESSIRYHGPSDRLNITAQGSSTVEVYSRSEGERVSLIGSLPRGVAVEPGCTDVWTIRLRTGKSVFFFPAKYNLQFTVIYQTQPLAENQDPDLPRGVSQEGLPRRYSNTTSFSVAIKAALWKVITGGVVGGFVGSVARILQNGREGYEGIVHAISLLILSVILSGTAIVFAARKSDTQSFVTVEDFWGGVLVGFLIGYSGTSAFSELTGVPSPSRESPTPS